MDAIGKTLMLRRCSGPFAASLIAAGLASGCAEKPQTIYDWGIYEALVYDMYARPGTADPDTQVVKLSEDIERAQSEGKRVAPGVHAHLGYMHYLSGNADAALDEFATERALFPESEIFVDGVFARLRTE